MILPVSGKRQKVDHFIELGEPVIGLIANGFHRIRTALRPASPTRSRGSSSRLD